MRIIALLAWFDEPLPLLAAYVDGLAVAGVDHLVAVDGRYQLYPDTKDVSPFEQRGVLDQATRHHGIGLTVYVPPGPWEGNEPEKRTRMFALALGSAGPGDWFAVIDADMIFTRVPADLHARLDATDREAADVRIRDMAAVQARRPDWPEHHDHIALFRAQPVVVGPQHYAYRSAVDRRWLWNGTDRTGLAEPLDLTGDVEIEHRPQARSPGRHMMKAQYYQRRDDAHVEMGACPRCGEQATERQMTNVRLVKTENRRRLRLPAGVVMEMCGSCAGRARKANQIQILQWVTSGQLPPDVDVDAIAFNERYALPDG